MLRYILTCSEPEFALLFLFFIFLVIAHEIYCRPFEPDNLVLSHRLISFDNALTLLCSVGVSSVDIAPADRLQECAVRLHRYSFDLFIFLLCAAYTHT